MHGLIKLYLTREEARAALAFLETDDEPSEQVRAVIDALRSAIAED